MRHPVRRIGISAVNFEQISPKFLFFPRKFCKLQKLKMKLAKLSLLCTVSGATLTEINHSLKENISDRNIYRNNGRHLSRINLSKEHSGNIGPIISKQSQETAIITRESMGFNFLHFTLLLVSSLLILGLFLGFVARRRRRNQSHLKGIPSILLESASGLGSMQERVSLESTRTQTPVPYYILPPSPEYDSIFTDLSIKKSLKELSKPKSALTIESCQSQESLSRFL